MTTSPAGRAMIEQFEGLRTSAYQDQRGIPTIGYGHTLGVKMGDTCSQAQADAWLSEDLRVGEDSLNATVTVTLNQNQFDALSSWTFNEGIGAEKHSTLLDLLNSGDFPGAANQLLSWDKIKNHGTMVVGPGLLNRRTKERALFLEPL